MQNTPLVCYICDKEYAEDDETYWKDKCDKCLKYVCAQHRHSRIEYDDGAVCDNCVVDVQCAICAEVYAKCYETCSSWTGCAKCHCLACPKHLQHNERKAGCAYPFYSRLCSNCANQ